MPNLPATTYAAGGGVDLPDDFIEAVEDLVIKLNETAEADAMTEREIGGLVEEIAPTLAQGQRMSFYNEVAAIVRRVAIRREYRDTSGRTIRYWRRTFGWCTRHGNQYPELTGTFVNAAVRVATVCQIEPGDVCTWAMNTGTRDVEAMEIHYLPQTSDGQEIDDPSISAFLRLTSKFKNHPRWPRFMRIVNLARREIKIMQGR